MSCGSCTACVCDESGAGIIGCRASRARWLSLEAGGSPRLQVRSGQGHGSSMCTRSMKHVFQAPGPPIPQSLECKGAQRGGLAQGQAWSCLESAQQFLGSDRSARKLQTSGSRTARWPSSPGPPGVKRACNTCSDGECTMPACPKPGPGLLALPLLTLPCQPAGAPCSRTEGDKAASQASIYLSSA